MRKRWTPEEEAIMREYFPGRGTYRMHHLLPNRSKSAIRRKADRMKLPRQPPPRQWTPRELNVMRANYTRYGATAIARYLPDRTIGAIYQKAQELGLRHGGMADTITTYELARCLGVSPGGMNRFVDRHGLGRRLYNRQRNRLLTFKEADFAAEKYGSREPPR